MFVDRAKILVKGGDGGNGCVAFRREKFVPRGGPSGGDGGNGGNVLFRATRHLNTLLPFRYQQHFRAERGGHGEGSNRHGKNGQDIVVEVPVGTQILNGASGELIADLVKDGDTVQIVRGGRGGKGNAAFVSSTNQGPRRAENGREGEQLQLQLELKVLADVGLIGYPNAGKSTLISVLSSARPKIGDYPFTTLSPQLGVVEYQDFRTLVVADIPGLIEGAHEGSGLGDQFLRHVERCRVLVHLVDVSGLGEPDPIGAYQKVNQELALYDQSLVKKRQLVVASKMDAAVTERVGCLRSFCAEEGLEFLEISSSTGLGITSLKSRLLTLCVDQNK